MDRRAQHLCAARQDAGRIVVDQRPYLQPRPAPGFRYLGAARQSRLGLSRRAALFQAAGAAGRRGRRDLSWPRRQSHRHDNGLERSAVRGLHGRRRQPRHSAQSRLQRRDPGGRVLLPAHHRERPAHERREGVPASGAQAGQCRCAHACACHQPHLRGQARGRRALSQGRQGRHPGRGARQQGSHSFRRHLQLAAGAAIVRRRLAGIAAIARHRSSPRAAGRRRGPAGSLRAAFGRARQEYQDHQ